MDHNDYRFRDILGDTPEAAHQFCTKIQDKWHMDFSKDAELAEYMKEWKKSRAIHLIMFGPDKVDELKTYQLLSDIYDSKKTCDSGETQVGSSDAEEDRTSECQLKQHLNALLLLIDNPDDLSEKIIKEAHCHLMKDLSSENRTINAGCYREEPVHVRNHNFTEYKDVPDSMMRIVEQ